MSAPARSCGSWSLSCTVGALAARWPILEQLVGWQRHPCSATTAAIAQLVAQVLPQSLAAAQELMMEQVADVRIAEAWLEMRGAHLEQLVETSLC